MERLRIVALIMTAFLIAAISSQKHKVLSLNIPYEQQLNSSMLFTQRYLFNITENQVNSHNNSSWHFFVQLQPSEDKEWANTQIVLSKSTKDQEQAFQFVRKCAALKGGVDSCHLSSQQFAYKAEVIHAKVNCRGPCKFNISASIQSPRKLELNKKAQIDSSKAASSRIFTLQPGGMRQKEQLRIILRPKTYLNFPAPIRLYVNHNNKLPTRQDYDYKGMILWDQGLGVFVDNTSISKVYTILVQSPERNQLILEATVVSQEGHHNLAINQPFDDHLDGYSKRSYQLSLNPKLGLSVQLTVFSGDVRIQAFYDENGLVIASQLQQQKKAYGQIEYVITPAILKRLNSKHKLASNIIVKMEAVKASTFVISYQELNQTMTQLIPQRNRYMEIEAKTINQYYIELTNVDFSQSKKLQFELVFRQAKSLRIDFYSCSSLNILTCQANNHFNKDQAVKNNDLTKILEFGVQLFRYESDKVGYYFSLSEFDFKEAQDGVKKYLFIVVVSNPLEETKFYSTQYINYGKNIYLRQKEVKSDRVLLSQSKYYSFTNRDADVQTIRIHVMEISGSVLMQGYLKDPRSHDNQHEQALPSYRNSMSYQQLKSGQTIYFKMTGLESSHYTVQLQLVKQRQKQENWWNKAKPQKQRGYNQILLSNNVPYQFNIESNSKEVYQIHSINKNFLLAISSSLPVQFCLTQNQQHPPFNPNCLISHSIKQQLYNISLITGFNANIGISNYQNKSIKFKITYTYSNDKQSQDSSSSSSDLQCLPGLFNHMNQYKFLKGMRSCYIFFAEKYEELQFTIEVISQQYSKVDVNVEINGVQKIAVLGTHHLFSKEQLEKVCKGAKAFCSLKIFVYSQVETQIVFALQYTNGPFFLLDGLANQFEGIRQSKYFVFDIYSKGNTTVIVQNKVGSFKFYGKIVDSADYYQNKTSFPSAKDKLIESANPFYNQYEIVILNDSRIHAVNCTQCLLLLTVQQVQSQFAQQSGSFMIECTQEDRFIKQRKSVVSFIAKHALQFYEYYNSQKGLILVTINTQNKECATMYMKQGVESRASLQNRERSSQKHHRNILLYDEADIGLYSLTVQGYENCYYSIDITSSPQSFRSIQKGLLKDMYLYKNQTTKFVFENNDNEAIKILSLHQNGQILISVKSYKNFLEAASDSSTRKIFTWSGRDFLRIDKGDKGYCSHCVYLIVITAQRQTRSSLLIPTAQSQFPLTIDSSIKDELATTQKERFKIFSQKHIIFEINVLYGSIKIQRFEMGNQTAVFSRIYDAANSTQYEEMFQFEKSSPPTTYGYYLSYSIIVIEALNDTSFSFGLISDMDVEKRGNTIKLGLPEYVLLDQNKKHCVYGTLDDASEQFLISITGQKQGQIMRDIILTCNVSGTLLKLKKQIGINEMMITIENAPKGLPKPYELCFLSRTTVYLTFIQSSKLNYLDQNKRLLVNTQINVTFYALGPTLIELNECTSRATTTISQTLNNIDSYNSAFQHSRKSNNLIQFIYYGPIFMNVKAETATVRWRQKNTVTGQGQGYDQYAVDRLRLNQAEDDSLQIEIYPLRKTVQNNKVSFRSIEYTVYIAEEEIYLYNAINCNQGEYISQSTIKTASSINSVTTIRIPISSLLQKFKQRKYLLVTVLATAQSSISNDANYRFIYNYMQLPLSALSSSNKTPQQIPIIIQNLAYKYMVYLMVLCILLFGGACIYKKCIHKAQKSSLSERDFSRSSDIKYQQFAS